MWTVTGRTFSHTQHTTEIDMVEVSWGELGVVVGVGLFLIGRKDLPKAAHTLGTQVGRVVGLLQGARARADRFTAQNELRQLQNELRSGLRELDNVKSELAVSMSTRGMMGRELGATVPSANRIPAGGTSASTTTTSMADKAVGALSSGLPSSSAATGDSIASPLSSMKDNTEAPPAPVTSTKTQTIGAVAEEEWIKQGIHFQSKAERGIGGHTDVASSGSALLAHALQQSLIHDQYDRVVAEHDASLQDRMHEAQARAAAAASDKKHS